MPFLLKLYKIYWRVFLYLIINLKLNDYDFIGEKKLYSC